MTIAAQPSTDRVIDVVAEALSAVLERDIGEIDRDTKLFEEIGLDSTGVLDLMMYLEEALEMQFYTENLEMSHFLTVGALADFIHTEMS
ncbi:acyl carrier protein [Micromonospora sp. NPDC049044]|uniref:acyl carrier protein n=1 Tax=unclassified Micromonospora TaxID=2617518 RepID=UPI0033F4BA28